MLFRLKGDRDNAFIQPTGAAAKRNLIRLQTLIKRSLTEPVPSIPEGFEMTVLQVFGQTLNKRFQAGSSHIREAV
jgi:hypothetical protein